jgi:hypothetical protein
VKIKPNYNDLLRLFEDSASATSSAGSYAVMEVTEPIWTKDIDVWIEPVPENAAKVLDALGHFGTPTGDVTVANLTDPPPSSKSEPRGIAWTS